MMVLIVIYAENYVCNRSMEKCLKEADAKFEYCYEEIRVLAMHLSTLEERVTNLENQINIVKQ